MRTTAAGVTRVASAFGTIIAPPISALLLDVDIYFSLGVYVVFLALSALSVILLPYETSNKHLKDYVGQESEIAKTRNFQYSSITI